MTMELSPFVPTVTFARLLTTRTVAPFVALNVTWTKSSSPVALASLNASSVLFAALKTSVDPSWTRNGVTGNVVLPSNWLRGPNPIGSTSISMRPVSVSTTGPVLPRSVTRMSIVANSVVDVKKADGAADGV